MDAAEKKDDSSGSEKARVASRKGQDRDSSGSKRRMIRNLIDDMFLSFRQHKKKRPEVKEKKKKSKPAAKTESKASRQYPSSDAQKEHFCKFLSELFALGIEGLIREYQTNLKNYVPPGTTRVAFNRNMVRNRYKDVVCIDQTRVVLKNDKQDYIHASYVRGDPLVNPFICTQGPMKNTVNDFWKMMIQEKVSLIFMLCNVVEARKIKCVQYWPPEEGETIEFAGVVIKNISVDDEDSTLVMTKLDVEGMPDKWVPTSVFAPFRMLKMARQSTSRPTPVHCSARIGRKGCIVALELCIQILLMLKPFNLICAIKQLRAMRMGAVQTDIQLVYVARCLVAYATACSVMDNKSELKEKATKFEDEYNAYLKSKESVKENLIADEAVACPEEESPYFQKATTPQERYDQKTPPVLSPRSNKTPPQPSPRINAASFQPAPADLPPSQRRPPYAQMQDKPGLINLMVPQPAPADLSPSRRRPPYAQIQDRPELINGTVPQIGFWDNFRQH
ncbi:unnamed protein product [Anisakis simplex]|uniref:Tyrosine-protein phosphatase domain-containing protein n=1 Tax=Anisakis simplex TaxID=6269 RepID=A0A0M3K6R7_ANISI|nr:unnamed protein product [Anisakis simplex]